MQQWFNSRSRSEQLILVLGAAAVLLYLIYVMLLRPMSTRVDNLTVQNQRAAESLQAVKQLASEYRQLEKSAGGKKSSGGNLTRVIDSSVKANQLVMSRFQPSSRGDVQVRFENAAFNNVLDWLHQLENRHGVIVKDLSITPTGNSGYVNVSVRVRQNS